VARRLVVPPHRDGGQAQYVLDLARRDPSAGLAPLMEWALRHLGEDLSVARLAARANMSPRTLARRFAHEAGTTPHEWLTHQRLLEAQRRLESGRESIDEVAAAVGFETAGTLRHHFRKHFRTTPTAYRRRFSLRS
jgi:transcriptional regulator GlxA family with amidase domain